MFKLPLFIVYAMIAFNITAFAIFLQLDMLIFNSIIAKIITWMFVVGTWTLAFRNRDNFIKIF